MIANTWVAVFRDAEEDDKLGDPVSAEAPVEGLERVPMAITEKTQRIFDAESDELRTVNYGVGRARVGTDLKTDDRLHDLRSGKWWAVREVNSDAPTFIGARDLALDLRAT